MKHELLRRAERAIARRRIAKAAEIAYMLWNEISSSDLEEFSDFGWELVRDAARQKLHKDYGTPSPATRALVLGKLRELENRKGIAAA